MLALLFVLGVAALMPAARVGACGTCDTKVCNPGFHCVVINCNPVCRLCGPCTRVCTPSQHCVFVSGCQQACVSG